MKIKVFFLSLVGLILLTICSMAQESNYLIICPDSLNNSALQFKEYRQSTGYVISIVNLSSIASDQIKNPEVIDTWIENYKSSHASLKYIVLLGSTELIPTYFSHDNTDYGGVLSNAVFDSDLWYSVQNDSLNSNYLPSIIVGRIPIKNTKQATNYLNKIKIFESNLDNLNTILFYGNKLEMELAKGINGDMVIAKNNGFDTISLVDPTENELFNVLNSRPIKAVIYYGHGNIWENAPLNMNNLMNWNDMQKPVLFFSGGCNFNDNTTSEIPLGDFLITSQNGSVSSIGASIEGGYGAGYSFIDGILKHFKGKQSIGELYNSALKYNLDYASIYSDGISIGSWSYYFIRRMNFIGDPGMKINTHVLQMDTIRINYTMCKGESYKGHTETCNFIEKFESVNGCDSVVLTKLTVNQLCTAQDDIPVLDSDGNIYNKINIGNQIWLTQNLNTTKFNDGISIPLVLDGASWNTLLTPSYCWYNNDLASNKSAFGALYNYYAVDTKKLCPIQWHVPTVDEWNELIGFLGGADLAGGRLKEMGTSHWVYQSSGITNSSGFTARPSGFHGKIAPFFFDKGFSTYYWSSSTSNLNYAIYLRSFGDETSEVNLSKDMGFSVRCIKDSKVLSNLFPLGNAGTDQIVNERTTVYLDGSTSSDPKGNSLTYKWTPPGGIILSSNISVKPTFVAPNVNINTNYTFSLIVNNGIFNSKIDSVIITVKNIDIPTGFNSLIDNGGFIIYPNPLHDKLIVKNSSGLKTYSIKIYSIDGILQFSSKQSDEESKIDISLLKSGVYIIQIINGSFKYNYKVMKN